MDFSMDRFCRTFAYEENPRAGDASGFVLAGKDRAGANFWSTEAFHALSSHVGRKLLLAFTSLLQV